MFISVFNSSLRSQNLLLILGLLVCGACPGSNSNPVDSNNGITDFWDGDSDSESSAADAGSTQDGHENEVDAGTDTGGTQTGGEPGVDSDSDGYTDAEENHAGTDPNDSESVIYEGGWPYNMNKDSIADPGWEGGAEVGSVLPHFIAMDQYEDMVDLYDFAFRGKKIVLDTGTPWCKPCKAIAAYLSDGDEDHLNWTGPQGDQPEGPYPWWSEDYSDLYRMVQEQEIYWITIIFSETTPIDIDYIKEWHDTYPHDHIPVLFDENNELVNHIPVTCYPTLNILDENLQFLNVTECGPFTGFRLLFE